MQDTQLSHQIIPANDSDTISMFPMETTAATIVLFVHKKQICEPVCQNDEIQNPEYHLLDISEQLSSI